ncbi:hypothetical protein PR048_008445 [Dryococelus australis]|uniref:Uncharacterized protein n=1 Tax=Dryococelus australis TaxID=614101 RepID=A0ABQ9HXX4_9NEOP|nr:hypothetical protein PR048_008445 [Dryococelus australis]
MPRNYTRKPLIAPGQRPSWMNLLEQSKMVSILSGKQPLFLAAFLFTAPQDSPVSSVGRKSVLSSDIEKALAVRLYLSRIGFGLTPNSIRKYAFNYVATRGYNFNIWLGKTGFMDS